ncbi:hypothetical protein N0V90_008566 [Kalmusia sp. IMI 367209]|nr:hypothetical protein N0V90_008566 [Kalmusia sp. IMI 367209]
MPIPSSQIRRGRRKSLRDDIKAAMILQDNPDLKFVPVSALKQLFHQATVASALEQYKKSLKNDVSSLQSFVCDKATRVFAILAWAESEPLIEQFYEYQFVDEQLPVRLVIDEDEDIVEAISFRLGKISIDKHPFNNYQWTDRNIEDFCNHYQWPFLSPVFRQNQFQYHFHERTRMPFVDERPKSQKESYFSIVEEWRIHRDHIHTPKSVRIPHDTNEHPVVAVKRLKQMSLSDAEFEAVAREEVGALEIIRNLNHPHLVNAVAYYTKGKSHYIVFPWASRGNLRDFWEERPPKLDRPFLKWVFTQLSGLAEAIKTLHHSHKERSTRHGDMKPENILCFDDLNKEHSEQVHSCILVIADVGLSRSHDKLTEFRKGATRTKSGTIKYEPPETELQPNVPRSRRYDVWSLGCIYLEFLVWMLYGPEELDHFREDLSTLGENTRFYVIKETPSARNRTARLNGVVQKWVDWIGKDPRCSSPTAIRMLLDLIVERLLIVDVSTARPFQSRRVPTFMENNSLASSAEPSTPSFSIRAPTVDFGSTYGLSVQSRATAEEMDDEMKRILELATSSTGERVEWINWNAPARQGPRRYGDRLGTTDASDRRDQQTPICVQALHGMGKCLDYAHAAKNCESGNQK